ncbi:MAG: hypothetical protein FJZ58_07045, partial [Chlamydiae bacterium]|nr:hypothetical protein [Chlamydiota bacterium]
IKRIEQEKSSPVYPTAKELWEKWKQALHSFPQMTKEWLWQEFALAYPRLVRSPKWQAQIEVFFSFIEKKTCSLEEWDRFMQNEEFFLQESRSKSKAGAHVIIFEELQKVFAPLYQESTHAKKLLGRLVQISREAYWSNKQKWSHYHPDDFVRNLQRALQTKENLQKQIQSKYKALVIDEFQDTDEEQWKLFQNLFLSVKERFLALYLVGDPKQSIYRFRKADIYVYLQAKKYFSPSECLYLDTNYRSHPDLVTALNAIFCSMPLKGWIPLPKLQMSLSVQPVKATKWQRSLLAEDKDKGRVHFLLQKQDDEKVLLRCIGEEILRLHREHGIAFRQVAILVRDRYQADLLQEVFHEFAIPCQVPGSFTKKATETLVMKDILHVLQDPTDRHNMKRLLMGVLFGYTQEELLEKGGGLFLQEMSAYFMQMRILCTKRGWGACFFSLLRMPFREGKEQTLGEHLLQRSDPSLYCSLRELAALFLERGLVESKDPTKLLAFLEDIESQSAAGERFFLAKEQEEEQVQVMTVHKSKGLEFPIVFALAAHSRSRSKGEEEIEEMEAEKLRLFYVALTRAKERVYIPVPAPGKRLSLGEASSLELFLSSCALEEVSLERVYANIQALSLNQMQHFTKELSSIAFVTHEFVTSVRSFPHSIQRSDLLPPSSQELPSWSKGYLLSFSSLHKEESGGKEFSFLNEPENDDLPSGPQTGVVVHAILEQVCKIPVEERGDSLQDLVRQQCRYTLLQGKEEHVFALVQQTLQTDIHVGKRTFTFGSLPHQDLRPEVEFLYPIGPSLMKGFIDVICRFQGKYYLVDWKTNTLGKHKSDYTKERMMRCMEERSYDLQAAIYARSLEKQFAYFSHQSFSSCFGGVIYFFLRGGTYLLFQPDSSLLSHPLLERPTWHEE